MRWDVFCRVIDNHGDLGVCWRLARGLAERGQVVRLWVDDPSALRWMAPQGADGVSVVHWTDPAPLLEPLDVVIEAFGCDPPPTFLAAMAERSVAQRAPLWLNLEYLSAEAWVERSHRLPSPQQSGPARGLTKWFFFPGFTGDTGGLLREPGLLQRRAAFDPAPWLATKGIARLPGERLVSLFCYPSAPIDDLPAALADVPTRLLLCGGTRAPAGPWPPGFGCQALPWFDQHDFDRLLWSCELNFVRGEDSLVRAIWAGAPFVWQAYPQHDGVHAAKLEAVAARLGATQVPGLPGLWRRWNGLDTGALVLPEQAAWAGWRSVCERWRTQLAAADDLVTQLLAFAAPPAETRNC